MSSIPNYDQNFACGLSLESENYRLLSESAKRGVDRYHDRFSHLKILLGVLKFKISFKIEICINITITWDTESRSDDEKRNRTEGAISGGPIVGTTYILLINFNK